MYITDIDFVKYKLVIYICNGEKPWLFWAVSDIFDMHKITATTQTTWWVSTCFVIDRSGENPDYE